MNLMEVNDAIETYQKTLLVKGGAFLDV